MALPDTSDAEHMAHIGRMTVLRKARREASAKLRDLMTPMLSAVDTTQAQWATAPIRAQLDQIDAINAAIEAIN
jgi:hypothetical protein